MKNNKEIKTFGRNKIYDIDISDRKWKTYLKKYGNKYQTFLDELKITHIRCKHGMIQTYSIVNEKLCFVDEFKTKNKKTFFKKKLNNHCEITQEGDLDIVVNQRVILPGMKNQMIPSASRAKHIPANMNFKFWNVNM